MTHFFTFCNDCWLLNCYTKRTCYRLWTYTYLPLQAVWCMYLSFLSVTYSTSLLQCHSHTISLLPISFYTPFSLSHFFCNVNMFWQQKLDRFYFFQDYVYDILACLLTWVLYAFKSRVVLAVFVLCQDFMLNFKFFFFLEIKF